MKNELPVGTHRTGLLVDGVDGTPFVVGTLAHPSTGRIQCSVPFLPSADPQFEATNRWFDMRNGALPKNLLFEDEKGSVSLFGLRTQFSSMGTGVSVGKFNAQAIVFARTEGSLAEEFTVRALRTKMDGLSDWVAAQAISARSIADEEGRLTGLNVSVESPAEIQWNNGDVQLALDVHWNWTGGRELKVEEYVLLRTEYLHRKATPAEHLQQHRMVRALLTISSGSTIAYREHWIKDDDFPLRMLNGAKADIPWQRAIFNQTVGDHYTESPSETHMLRSMVSFEHLGPSGMESWARVYQLWRRPIDVLFGLLSKPVRFIEDRLLAASMAIEAAGHLIGPIEGEPGSRGRNVAFATQVYRCLRTVEFNPTGIAASEEAFALAAASVYRRIKHPEHEMPDSLHSWLISHVLVVVVRAALVMQVPQARDAVSSFMRHTATPEMAASFRDNDLYIDPTGSFVANQP